MTSVPLEMHSKTVFAPKRKEHETDVNYALQAFG